MASILRRLSGSRFSEVVPGWAGETVVLLAGGSSLSVEQVEIAHQAHADKRVRCIVINDSFLLAPWADACYAADASWHADVTRGIPKKTLYGNLSVSEVADRWSEFAGSKVSIESGNTIADENVHMIRACDLPIWSGGRAPHKETQLWSGRHSGHQALTLAILAGATRAFLCGYDGRRGDKGRTHWHGGHANPMGDAFFDIVRQGFAAAENAIKSRGVEVLNCSPGSAIDTFPKVKLEDALALAVA